MAANTSKLFASLPPGFIRKIAGAKGVQSDGIATADIPSVGRHYQYLFEFKKASGTLLTQAQIESEVSEVRVKINGEIIIEASPAFLFDRQDYYLASRGASVNDGILMIDWEQSHLTKPEHRAIFPLGMADVRSVTIEFTLGTLANLSIIDVTVVSTNESAILGTHLRIKKHAQSFNSTGEQVISDLPIGRNYALLAYHIGLGSGALTDVSLTANNTQLIDRVSTSVETAILEKSARTIQSGYFSIDFGRNNEMLSFLKFLQGNQMVQDWRLGLNWGTNPSGLYNIYGEYYYNLPANA